MPILLFLLNTFYVKRRLRIVMVLTLTLFAVFIIVPAMVVGTIAVVIDIVIFVRLHLPLQKRINLALLFLTGVL
ncbi:hypothetical protein BJY00DRAFT_317333 [Aspergillus carlsbadensis]|nr:hypothetical protein BJY00DRAFT_317333 [Aspergillus carlsbadensis]